MAHDLFGTAEVAAGYASARPAVHPQVVDLVRARVGLTGPVGTVVDLGCGAGASTAALLPIAGRCLGIDPSPSMVAAAGASVPGASFAVARAEAVPVGDGSVDLVAAAGSLDFADQDAARPEVLRILRDGGLLLAYDFGTGLRLGDGRSLAPWFDDLLSRWPKPHRERPAFDPEAWEDNGLRAVDDVLFEIPVVLDRARYLDYLLTESNVTQAVAQGTDPDVIRGWCESTLPWDGVTEAVCFEGRATTYRRSGPEAQA